MPTWSPYRLAYCSAAVWQPNSQDFDTEHRSIKQITGLFAILVGLIQILTQPVTHSLSIQGVLGHALAHMRIFPERRFRSGM